MALPGAIPTSRRRHPSGWTRASARPIRQADAYLMSCTNIQSMAVIEALEQRLGKPVITSNQATLWYCLRACGLPDVIPGLGKLFTIAPKALAAV